MSKKLAPGIVHLRTTRGKTGRYEVESDGKIFELVRSRRVQDPRLIAHVMDHYQWQHGAAFKEEFIEDTPNIDLGNWRDHALVIPAVLDDDVDEVVNNRVQAAGMKLVPFLEATPAEGDRVSLEIVAEGEKPTQAVYTVGDPTTGFPPELSNALTGLRPGDSAQVVVEDEGGQRFLTIRLLEAWHQEPTPLNEVANRHGFPDVDTWKQAIRSNLEDQVMSRAVMEVVDEVVHANPGLEPPDPVVARRVRGRVPDDVTGEEREYLMRSVHEEARREILREMVLDRLAAVAGTEVTAEEIAAYIGRSVGAIEAIIRRRKAVQFLMEYTKKVVFTQQGAPQEEERPTVEV